MTGTFREEDVAYVSKRFREIAEYLEKRDIPGTIWGIKTENYVYEFVTRRRQKKENEILSRTEGLASND